MQKLCNTPSSATGGMATAASSSIPLAHSFLPLGYQHDEGRALVSACGGGV